MAQVSLRTIVRSERYAAISLAGAAALGLLLANSVAGPGLIELSHTHLGFAGLQLDLSVAHWISDGLLAIFFFIIAVELRHELTVGELNSIPHAMAPAIAALGGVIVPVALYLLIAGGDFSRGWPIPTATDIAFALGLIALVGKGIPPKIRVFLLALAVLDDLIAILIIAVFFTASIDLLALGMAIIAVFVFRYLGCRGRMNEKLRTVLLILVGLFAWYATYQSGVHATIAGVALGLVLMPRRAQAAADRLQPVTNAVILPLFAFTSALVVIPHLGLNQMSPAFWGIAVALPVGKILGVTLAGTAVALLAKGDAKETLIRGFDLVTVSAVAGIGFTVSLLMNELAFAGEPGTRDQGVLGVLVGSAMAIVIAIVFIRIRISRSARKQRVSAQ